MQIWTNCCCPYAHDVFRDLDSVMCSHCSGLLSRLRVDLITLVGLKCPSVRPQKVSSISMKFGISVEVDE